MVIFAFLFCSCKAAYAQEQPINQEPKLDYQGMNLRLFLERKAQYPPQLLRKKEMAITFAKFKVSKTGKIDTVYMSRGTDESIRLELNAAFKRTNGYWTPKMQNGQLVESDTYLLPLQFKLENTRNNGYSLDKNYRQTLDQFSNLFDFQDGSKQPVNQFIILDPIIFVGYTPMYTDQERSDTSRIFK